jgi:hypothetical protein
MSAFYTGKYKEIGREIYSHTTESYAKYGGGIFESLASPLLEVVA